MSSFSDLHIKYILVRIKCPYPISFLVFFFKAVFVQWFYSISENPTPASPIPPLSAHLIKIHSIWGVTRRRTSNEMWQVVREMRCSAAFSPISCSSWHSSSTARECWSRLTAVERACQDGRLVNNWNAIEGGTMRGDTWGEWAWCWHRFELTGWNIMVGFLTFRQVYYVIAKNTISADLS